MPRSLPIEISRFQNSDEAMGNLARSAQLEDLETASRAYAGCAPVIVKALVERCSTPEGTSRMLQSAQALRWSERDRPEELFKNANRLVGEDVADQIFDQGLPSVVAAVVSSSEIGQNSAGTVVEVASAVALACLADHPDQDLDYPSFVGAVDRAATAFGIDSSLSSTAHQHADQIRTNAALLTEQQAAAAPGEKSQVNWGRRADDGAKKSAVPLLAVCAVGCVLGVAAIIALSGVFGGGSMPDEVAFEASTEAPTTTEPQSTTAAPTTTEPTTTAAEPTTSDAAAATGQAANDENVFTLSVPLADTTGAHPDASGLLMIDLNTETGEVCYNVQAENIETPLRSHIHIGAAGEDGGIVVDLGERQNGDTGCAANNPGDSMTILDTRAILSNLDGHYVELTDASEEWGIRGQLSEASEAGDVRSEVAQLVADDALASADSEDDAAADEAESTELIIDPDSGGATILIRNGVVVLQGEVADPATADAFRASLGDLGETEIVDELVVAPGAPIPSGRVLVADAILFADNSDAVNEAAVPTLQAMKYLAQSRPDWVVTIVGHTDSTGSAATNLELSLRRATAVREILRAKGVPEDNLRVEGAGETQPVADNNTVDGRVQNRRIELEFTPAS